MIIKTKYDFINLYFIYKGIVRYIRPISIIYRELHDPETKKQFPLINYCFQIDKEKTIIQVEQSQVFKTRKELLTSLI